MPIQIIHNHLKTREKRGKRMQWVVPVTCAGCGYQRILVLKNAEKSKRDGSCFMCAQREKAKKGFQAAVKSRGWHWAVQNIQTSLNAKPSKPERALARLLEAAGVSFETNVLIYPKTRSRKRWAGLLDFVIFHEGRQYAVEVDGAYWHQKPENAARDRRKERLLHRRRIPILRIDAAQIGAGVEQHILNWITGGASVA